MIKLNVKIVQKFELQNNKLGGYPLFISFLETVQYIDVSNNRLEGPIPGDLGTAPLLYFLNVSANPGLRNGEDPPRNLPFLCCLLP